ncbi:MAG: calcium-binding protein, partial [Actinobacteria bacterium]|nr:calcium-binding protein [Actinomycetota bacterium]
GTDVLVGGVGDDVLEGGEGSDRYVYERGHGVATIRDGAGNTLALGSGISTSGLSLALGSLVIETGTPGDAVRVEGFDPDRPHDSP